MPEIVIGLDYPAYPLRLTAHDRAGATHEVHEESRHVLALQRVSLLDGCEGRYLTTPADDRLSPLGRLLFAGIAAAGGADPKLTKACGPLCYSSGRVARARHRLRPS